MRSFMTKLSDPVGSTLSKNCLPTGFGPIQFKPALILATTVTKMVKDKPRS